MNLKIMVTGKNKRIAIDVSHHLEADRGYKVVKCEASFVRQGSERNAQCGYYLSG